VVVEPAIGGSEGGCIDELGIAITAPFGNGIERRLGSRCYGLVHGVATDVLGNCLPPSSRDPVIFNKNFFTDCFLNDLGAGISESLFTGAHD
jgi:hypothetical protein